MAYDNYGGDYEFTNPETGGTGYASFSYGDGDSFAPGTKRPEELKNPDKLYYSFMNNAQMSPNQRQYYKYNFSDVYQDFLTDRAKDPMNSNRQLMDTDWTSYLGGYKWDNEKYNLFGSQNEKMYNFISPSLRWY